MTMILCFVVFPAIAQHGVNKSTLDLQSMVLSNPTADSVTVTQNGILHNYTPFVPHLDAMNVSLFLEDTEPNIKPFAQLEMAAVTSGKTTPVSITNQTMHILDMDQFIRYTNLTMFSETFRLALRGHTKLTQGALHHEVQYNEVLTLKGLNNMKGFNISSFTVHLKPEADGANLIGKVYIPNPTIMTIYMGNVTQDLSIAGDPIGTSLMPNLILKPGDNFVDMRSTTDQVKVLKHLADYKDGNVPIDIVGNSSIYDGVHLKYYEIPLQAQHLQTKLHLTPQTLLGQPGR